MADETGADLTVRFKAEAVDVLNALSSIIKGLDAVEQKSKEVSNKFSTNLRNLNNSITNVTNKMTGAFRSQLAMFAGMVGVGGFTATIVKAIKAADAWEEKMASLSIALGNNLKMPLAEVEKQIKALAKTTVFSSGEMSDAFRMIAKSGVKGADELQGAMKILDASQKLAVATNSSLGQTVSGVSKIMTAFGISAENAESVTNKLLITARKSGLEFSQLSGTMGYLATQANQAGISFDDLMAATIGMQKAGVPARNTMMALSTIIQSIQNPSKTLKMHFDNLKTGFKDLNEMVQKKGLGSFFEVLQQISGGSNENLKKLIPNIRAIRGAGAMAGEGLNEMRKALEEFKSASNETDVAFKKMMDTKEFEMFQKKVDSVLTKIGTALLPKVMETLDSLGKWFDANSDQIVKDVTSFVTMVIDFLKFIVNNAKTIVWVMGSIWVVEKIAGITNGVMDLVGAFTSLKNAVLAMNTPGVLKLLSLLGIGAGGAALATLAAGAAAAGATIYTAGNLADPKNKIKPSEMYPGTGWKNEPEAPKFVIPGTGGTYTGPTGSIPGLGALGAGGLNLEDLGAMNSGPYPGIPRQKVSGSPVSYGTKKIATAEEVAKWKKEREAALKALHDFEVSKMTERGKLMDKFEKERLKWSEMKGLKDEEKQTQLHFLQQSQAEELAKFDNEQQKKRDEYERSKAQYLEKVGEDYHEMRMTWAEQEDKKRLDAQEYLDSLRLDAMNEQEKASVELQKDLTKIGSMLLTPAQKAEAIFLRTQQYEKSAKSWTSMTFWKDVAKGFATKLGETLYDWSMKIIDLMTTPISAIVDFAGSLFGGFKTIGAAPFTKMTDIFNTILGGGTTNDAQQAAQQAALFFEQLAQNLPIALRWFANEGVPQIISAFVDNLPTVIGALVDGIPKILESVIDNLDKIILPFVDGMLTLIPKLIELLPQLIGKVAELLGPMIGKIFSNLPSILASMVKGTFEGIGSLFSGLVKGIGDIFKDKSKSEKARENQSISTQTAMKLGYSEEEAKKLGEQVYEKTMGRAYDTRAVATYMKKFVYNMAISEGKTEEEAQALANKEYQNQLELGEKENKGKLTSRTSEGEEVDVGTHSNGSPYEGLLPSVYNRAQAEEAAKKKAMEYYTIELVRKKQEINAAWADEEDRLRRRGIPDDQIEQAHIAWLEKGTEEAYDAAEDAYQQRYKSILDYLLSGPGYMPDNVGKMHLGGIVEHFANAIRAHSGIMVPRGLAPDEVPIIAQVGEAVMNKNWVQNAGGKAAVDQMNRMGSPAGGGGVVNNVYVEHMMSGDTAQVVDKMLSDNLITGSGKLYEKFNTGRAVGYRTRRS